MRDLVTFINEISEALAQLFAGPAPEMFKKLREHPPAPAEGHREHARWLFACALARDAQAEPVKRAVDLIPEGMMKANLNRFTPDEKAAVVVAAWIMGRNRYLAIGCSMAREHAIADAFGIPAAAVGGSNIPVFAAQRRGPQAFRIGIADMLALRPPLEA